MKNRKDPGESQLSLPPHASEGLTVEAIKSHPDFVFEPWFRTRRVSYQIRALKNVSEREVWTVVFKKWGCISCGTKRKPHASLGMCAGCRQRWSQRLHAALRPHADSYAPETFTFDSEEIARRALADARQVLLAAATKDDDDQA